MVNQQKKTQVQSLIELFQKRSNFVLVKFSKTTHQSLESLRKDLKKNSSAIKVMKNTLLEKTINKLAVGNKLFFEYKKRFLPLKQSSALLTFSQDWNKGLKTLYQFMQKEKTLSFKSGILDNQIFEDSAIITIAQLPGKDELMAKIIGSMKNPMNKFVYTLRFNTNKFVYILQKKVKGGE